MSRTTSKKRKPTSVVAGKELSLTEWLDQTASVDNHVFPDFAFPTNQMREEYLASISERSADDVKQLIRRFLIHTCTTKWDTRDFSVAQPEPVMECEQFFRMLRGEPAWEGLTWVLELLDRSPRRAIEVLKAYVWAHLQPLDRPYWYERIYDAMALIRAKYVEIEKPREILLELGSHKFERLVLSLYQEIGYEVESTPRSYDGGVDIRAHQGRAGQRYMSLIQCKCVSNNVGVKEIRELHGTVENEKVSKGILVTSAKFTPKAREWAHKNPRLELIDFEQLNQLLNEHLGPLWAQRIDWYCRERSS